MKKKWSKKLKTLKKFNNKKLKLIIMISKIKINKKILNNKINQKKIKSKIKMTLRTNNYLKLIKMFPWKIRNKSFNTQMINS